MTVSCSRFKDYKGVYTHIQSIPSSVLIGQPISPPVSDAKSGSCKYLTIDENIIYFNTLYINPPNISDDLFILTTVYVNQINKKLLDIALII